MAQLLLVDARTAPISGTPSRNPHRAKQSKPMLQRRLGWAMACIRGSRRRYFSSHGVRTARAGRPATLVNSTTSSGRALTNTRLNASAASDSAVTAKAVPSWTAAAPSRCRRRTSSWVEMPPAAMIGMSRSMPSRARNANTSGIATSKSKRRSVRSATQAAPRCPPASRGCSRTMRRAGALVHPAPHHHRHVHRTEWESAPPAGGPAPARAGQRQPCPHHDRIGPAGQGLPDVVRVGRQARITLTAITPCPAARRRARRISRSNASRLAASMRARTSRALWSRWLVCAMRSDAESAQVDGEMVPTRRRPQRRCRPSLQPTPPRPCPPAQRAAKVRPPKFSGLGPLSASQRRLLVASRSGPVCGTTSGIGLGVVEFIQHPVHCSSGPSNTRSTPQTRASAASRCR